LNSKVTGVEHRKSGREGQGLVEFALVVPLLLLLLLGIAEFGRAWMTRNILTGATREAVRVAAVPPPAGSMAAARARATAVLASAGITTPPARIEVTDAPAAYGAVTVTVNYDFPWLFAGFIPGLGGPTLPLRSTTTMRREY
jgi:Flp pilus assembly protein TadG